MDVCSNPIKFDNFDESYNMSRKKNIEALLKRAEESLPKIKEEYNKSLHETEISEDLKIDIKEYFGNLRSVLDYLANDIVDKFCPDANPRDNVYFPIRMDERSFVELMNKFYPDLPTNSLEIYEYLKRIQPYQGDQYVWLSHFNKINNEHKHERLVPQTRSETKTIKAEIKGGGFVSWNPDAVKFGPGVFIGGVPVDLQTQMPVTHPDQKVTVQIWVDFQFEDINVSAIFLTQEALDQIKKIYSTLSPLLS